MYLGLIIRRLLEALEDKTKISDKDYYGNKRLECAGWLLELLFDDKFKTFNTEVKRELDRFLAKLVHKQDYPQSLEKHCSEITGIFISNQKIITKGLQNALTTGNWSIKRFKMERAGVT